MNGRGASDLAGDYAGTSRSLPSPQGAARPVSARWAGRSAGGRARPVASPTPRPGTSVGGQDRSAAPPALRAGASAGGRGTPSASSPRLDLQSPAREATAPP
jgi:hypothetical protein